MDLLSLFLALSILEAVLADLSPNATFGDNPLLFLESIVWVVEGLSRPPTFDYLGLWAWLLKSIWK